MTTQLSGKTVSLIEGHLTECLHFQKFREGRKEGKNRGSKGGRKGIEGNGSGRKYKTKGRGVVGGGKNLYLIFIYISF